jgi:hypothetical protein
MNKQVHGYPVTGFVEEEDSDDPQAGATGEPRPLRLVKNRKWEAILSRNVNALHPNARLRFVASFLLGSPRSLGRQARRRLRQRGLPAPDAILLSLDAALPGEQRCDGCVAASECSGAAMTYDELNRVVSEGQSAGIHLYFLLTRYPLSYREEVLDLGLRHRDCAFILLGPAAILDGDFLQDLAEAGNVAVLLNVDGYALETDSLRGAGAYSRFHRSLESARGAGVPFGFTACCYNGNTPSVLSRGFLEALVADGALFGVYYPHLALRVSGVGSLRLGREALMSLGGKIRELKERSPIALIDVHSEVSFVGQDPRGSLLLHRVDSSIRNLTLLESLECAAQGLSACLYPGDPEHRGVCPLLNEEGWPKRLLCNSLAADQRREPLSFGDSSNEGQWVPVAL